MTILDSEFAKNLQIDTAAGSDTVSLDNVEAASLTLKLGDGLLDIAELVDVTVAGKLAIDGGNGDDAVDLEEIEAGEIAIDFRQGQSDLDAEIVAVTGRFSVKGGDLNNAIQMDFVAPRSCGSTMPRARPTPIWPSSRPRSSRSRPATTTTW